MHYWTEILLTMIHIVTITIRNEIKTCDGMIPLSIKQFKLQCSTICTVFFDGRGIIKEHLTSGATINSKRYVKKLINLKTIDACTRPEKNKTCCLQ